MAKPVLSSVNVFDATEGVIAFFHGCDVSRVPVLKSDSVFTNIKP